MYCLCAAVYANTSLVATFGGLHTFNPLGSSHLKFLFTLKRHSKSVQLLATALASFTGCVYRYSIIFMAYDSIVFMCLLYHTKPDQFPLISPHNGDRTCSYSYIMKGNSEVHKVMKT